mgnify:CR=1 FL=1
MLYKKNGEKKLSKELFQNPTSEYRATPFWAWNCKLEKKELEWQLEILKKMGFVKGTSGGRTAYRVGVGLEIDWPQVQSSMLYFQNL